MGLAIEDNVRGLHGWCGREFDGFCSNDTDETDGGRQALSTGQGDREEAAASELSTSRAKLGCGFSASGGDRILGWNVGDDVPAWNRAAGRAERPERAGSTWRLRKAPGGLVGGGRGGYGGQSS